MGLVILVFLAVLTGVTGSPAVTIRPEAASADSSAHPNTPVISGQEQQQTVLVVKEAAEDVMATGELNPSYYPAQRAAQVVQHYLNTRYGSPYRVFGLHSVHSARAEGVEESGRKYQLEISVNEYLSNIAGKCTAEVFFPTGEKQGPPEVQALCDEHLKINTKDQEEALYQQYKRNQSLLSAQHLPDSYGHIEPDMKQFWRLGIVAASFVMLNESTENTLYNMAQVETITQLQTENDQLKFDYDILLHEMVSQEIIHWKLLLTWSPAEGVKVLQKELLPRCHCEKPQNTN